MKLRHILIALVALVIGFFVLRVTQMEPRISDPKDAEYLIDGQKIKLEDGVSEISIPGSAAKIITTYFGNEVKHDLNDDGREDTVFLLTQAKGGSGTFFYVVSALHMPNGYIGSDAVLLGDRIAPQTTEIEEGKTALGSTRKNVIVVNYVDRRPGEPMTVAPSVGKSIWLMLDPSTMRFAEVAKNFEGEER